MRAWMMAMLAGVSCAALGLRMRGALSARAAALSAWRAALSRLEQGMRYTRAGMPALLRAAAGGGETGGAGALLGDLARRMEDAPCESPARLLEEAAAGKGVWTALSERERALLYEGLEALCAPVQAEGLAALGGALAALDLAHADARAACARNGRLYAALGVWGGAALFLILC